MATVMPEQMSEEVLTWAAESYLPSKLQWTAMEGKAEQDWYDLLAMVRCSLEDTDPSEWP